MVDPELTEGTTSPICPIGTPQDPPERAGKRGGREICGQLPSRLEPGHTEDNGWILGWFIH